MSKTRFTVENPDLALSPHTGMGRGHWIEAGKYIMERAFRHVRDFDDLIIFPVVPDSKTYPQPGDPPWRTRSLEFEGLRRTTTVAAPLMHAEPEVEIKGIRLRDYYCHHLYRALTPGHPNSVPLPEELPDATYQFTCELGGLAMFLLRFPDVIWPHIGPARRDAMAETLSKWAHHRTTQNNWRFFNICMLTFLKVHGYPIDEQALKDHLDWISSYHAGGGWYLEQNYNYYTISMYCLYQTVWARAYGDQHESEAAAAYDRTARQLMASFPHLFGRDGYMNMWARSIVYRLWVAGGFPVAFMLKGEPLVDPGFARRLCSGTLLQFIGNPDFYENEVPALGFYRHVEYCLQGYSCSASPFTMFMPFLNLSLPEDSPFWTATENEGFWPELGTKTLNYSLPSPGLLLSNHGNTGTSEIRPAKVNEEDHNYNRLCYNTHFPWEDHVPDGGTAMSYAFRSLDPRDTAGKDTLFYLGLSSSRQEEQRGLFNTPKGLFYNGYRGGVLYRQAIFYTPPNNGSGYTIDLADIVLPGCVLRVDRSRLAFEHELTLGHFGLPHMGGAAAVVERRVVNGCPVITARIPGRQLALVVLHGWDGLEHRVHRGRNAEADESTVIFARRRRLQRNPKMELMLSLLLHKRDDTPWTDAELYPFRDYTIHRWMPSGSSQGLTLNLPDGSACTVDFEGIDGLRQN
jgi:hypothetical protein